MDIGLIHYLCLLDEGHLLEKTTFGDESSIVPAEMMNRDTVEVMVFYYTRFRADNFLPNIPHATRQTLFVLH